MASEDANIEKDTTVQNETLFCVIRKDEVAHDTQVVLNELLVENSNSESNPQEKSAMNVKEEYVTAVIGHKLYINHEIDTVQKEYDASIDERLPETVTLLTAANGAKVYLVGTAHFSVQSQNDVATIIQAVQPHIVVVELCLARINFLNMDEDALYNNTLQCMSIRNIRSGLKQHGPTSLLYLILSRMINLLVKQLEMPPGGEFRIAFQEAKKVPNCIIYLADRSFAITVQRAMRALTWWELIKLVKVLWLARDVDFQFGAKDVERYKQKNFIEEMNSKLKDEYPAIERTFVKERDLYLAYHLQAAAMRVQTPDGLIPPRIVAVVGIGHIGGIVENWGKVKPSDIWPLMSVPPQSLSTRLLKLTFGVSLLGAVVYVGYKIVRFPYGSALQAIKSSFEGLLNVGNGN